MGEQGGLRVSPLLPEQDTPGGGCAAGRSLADTGPQIGARQRRGVQGHLGGRPAAGRSRGGSCPAPVCFRDELCCVLS